MQNQWDFLVCNITEKIEIIMLSVEALSDAED